jgi:hypothetical protein
VSILVVLGALILFAGAVLWVNRHRGSLVPRRGTSVGADLGALSDKPRVRVHTVTPLGANRVHLVLDADPDNVDRAGIMDPADLDLVVFLQEGEAGLELLHEWARQQTLLAIVIPPGSRLVRLRAIDNLQPLTLRRDDQA